MYLLEKKSIFNNLVSNWCRRDPSIAVIFPQTGQKGWRQHCNPIFAYPIQVVRQFVNYGTLEELATADVDEDLLLTQGENNEFVTLLSTQENVFCQMDISCESFLSQ